MNLNLLTNDELLKELVKLRTQERSTQVLFLRHLAEVDRRRLYADEGYSSLFRYVTQVLRYSESSALKRIQVARASVKFPELLCRLESGKLSLTVLSKTCPHLEDVNVGELLDKCEGLSVREVERLLAPAQRDEKPDEIRPVSHGRSRILFTASEAFVDKLQEAKALLSGKHPKGSLEAVFSEALDVLIEMKTPKAVAKRISRHATSHSKHIPVAVQAEVWERDQGRCSFVAENGHTCGEKSFLEYDHVFPWALGGSSHESGNIRLLCRTHNRLVAEQHYGKKFMEEKIYSKVKTFDDELAFNQPLLRLWAVGGWTAAKLDTRGD